MYLFNESLAQKQILTTQLSFSCVVKTYEPIRIIFPIFPEMNVLKTNNSRHFLIVKVGSDRLFFKQKLQCPLIVCLSDTRYKD